MKTLDLKNFGVQEMDARDLTKVDGGGWQWDVIFYIGEKIIENWDDVQGTSNAIRAAYKKHPQALLK